jgi:hypothetical protein
MKLQRNIDRYTFCKWSPLRQAIEGETEKTYRDEISLFSLVIKMYSRNKRIETGVIGLFVLLTFQEILFKITTLSCSVRYKVRVIL